MRNDLDLKGRRAIKMHLEEKTISVEKIYNGKIIDVTREKVMLENKSEAYREVVHHSGGVCILPINSNNEVLFVKQYRYPFKEVLLEIPAGKREEGEDPKECGIRELKEEVGAESKNITCLGKLYPTVAYDTEVIFMYMAQDLSFGEQDLDEDEFLDIVKIPLEKAYKMVINDEIPDAKTQIAILKAWEMLKNKE